MSDVVVITGASSGIGRAVARRFADPDAVDAAAQATEAAHASPRDARAWFMASGDAILDAGEPEVSDEDDARAR